MRRLVLFAILVTLPASADEGMWLLSDFPSGRVKEKHGFAPSSAWLEQVRLASVRLTGRGGCSGSFVSANGLVLTNHHCAQRCVQQLSTPKQDLMREGHVAKGFADERRCPEIEINQLVGIEDVTARIQGVTSGLECAKFHHALKAEMNRLEKDCSQEGKLRCDAVTLYHGGRYHLYKYRRYQDVRLVFAPEYQIAFFGGDPDNFMFPRWDFDMSLLRVYEGDRPASTPNFFKFSPAGAKEGDLVFVTGHPGRTSRLKTVAQLEVLRDVSLPLTLTWLAELRGTLTQFGRKGPEQKRIGLNLLFGIENSFKALSGQHAALLDKEFFVRKVAAEQALRAKVAADPEKSRRYGAAWDAIAKAQEVYRTIRKPYGLLESSYGFYSRLFKIARSLVRAADELAKPNEKRLREFGDAALPSVKQLLFSRAPIYPELEELTLTFSLTKLRELLGPDDPIVRKVLGKQSPEELAHALVTGSKLQDSAVRRELWAGGRKAIDASDDPMIKLALRIDPDARALREKYESEVAAAEKKAGDLIAKVYFEVHGTTTYPDATFTLRISYGTVKGWEENGRTIDPFTTIQGAFDRATGKDPFALPQSWLDAKERIKLDTPMNFVTTNDIIGGNSGSPAINKEAEIVGLVFDGNIHSLGGAFGFDESKNRTVLVQSAAIIEALRSVYSAFRLVQELEAGRGGAASAR